MRPIDAEIVTNLKDLQDDIRHNINPLNKDKRKLGRDRFILAKVLNQVVESGQYDTSPLDVDLRDLGVFSDHHAAVIRGMAELVFGGFWTRRRVPSAIKRGYQDERALIGTSGFLYGSNEIESQHWRIIRQRIAAEEAEKRKTIKSVDVVRHDKDMAAALQAGALGPEYYPACFVNQAAQLYGFFPWLKRQSPDDWHVAVECGFNGTDDDLMWIISQPDCDRATAAVVFSRAFAGYGGDYYLQRAAQSTARKARPLLFEEIGRKWNAGAYAGHRFAWDLDLWILEYRDDFLKIRDSDVASDWLIDPDDLVAREGSTPDSAFYFGDQTAYFKSAEIAEAYLSGDAEGRALQAWLEN
ncbi:MAG: hypothetical protein AAGJ28_14550 [Pseudomonadota bacterium]